ncbi:MAG TPA: heme exporter protein CcmD [Acidiferrobacterales bacterium]|nr:heme exporter protein CcmD [Acidiferrobacterales bacterium]
MNWADFLAMGGYGFYVWSAYAFAALILAVNVVLPLQQKKTVLKILREYIRAKPSA